MQFFNVVEINNSDSTSHETAYYKGLNEKGDIVLCKNTFADKTNITLIIKNVSKPYVIDACNIFGDNTYGITFGWQKEPCVHLFFGITTKKHVAKIISEIFYRYNLNKPTCVKFGNQILQAMGLEQNLTIEEIYL